MFQIPGWLAEPATQTGSRYLKHVKHLKHLKHLKHVKHVKHLKHLKQYKAGKAQPPASQPASKQVFETF